MLKKILCIFTASAVILLTACGNKEKPAVEGDGFIKSAQQSYTSLDSATMIITDEATGSTVSEFSFKYNGNTLTYSLVGSMNNSDYMEYNDGKTLQIKSNDKVSSYGRFSKSFKKYTRKKTNPNASAGILFFEPEYIESADVKTDDNGTKIIYKYKTLELGNKMKLNTDKSSLDHFETEFHFDSDGNFLILYERSEVTSDGKSLESNFTVTVENRDLLTEIINPIKGE